MLLSVCNLKTPGSGIEIAVMYSRIRSGAVLWR